VLDWVAPAPEIVKSGTSIGAMPQIISGTAGVRPSTRCLGCFLKYLYSARLFAAWDWFAYSRWLPLPVELEKDAMKLGTIVSVSVIVAWALSATACDNNNGTPPAPTACGYTLASTTQASPAGGGSFAVTVTKTSGNCTWTAASDSSWMTFSGSTSGSAGGTINYTVAPNTGTTTRTGTITVQYTGGSAQLVVTQAGVPAPAGCTYTLTPASQSVPLDGGTFTATVSATGSGCSWTASSSDSWITITSGTSATSTGTITYTVSMNPDATPRTGIITVNYSGGSAQLTVAQTPITACIYTLSPASQNVPFGGGTFSFNATRNTANGCSWSVSTSTPWITLTGAMSGLSPGVITFAVAANTSPSSRNGTVSVVWSGGSADFAVAQSGVACTFAVVPTSQAVLAAGGFFSATITPSDNSCSWTAMPDVPWMSITTGGSGTGSGTVVYVVLTNGTGSSRSGNVLIQGSNNNASAQVAVTQSP
jgi:hypothetical protein